MSQATLSGGYHNSNLFSNYYLDERVYDLDAWDCDEEASEVYEELQSLYEAEGDALGSYKEDPLLKEWIDEVLDALGYQTLSESTLPDGGGYVDRLLFDSAGERRDAANLSSDGMRSAAFKKGIGVLEAKQWGTDFESSFNEDRQYRNASHQIKFYLEATPENIDWGILTDGKKWRLYGTKDYETNTYYEVDLPELLLEDDLEAFKRFYVFFRSEAFREVSGTTFLDEVWSESENAAQELGEDLQDNVFTALRILGEGFVESNDLDIDPADDEAMEELKEQSLVLLYRLMFLLYAEGRGLIHPEGPHAQQEYQENFSLEQIRKEIYDEVAETQDFDSEYSEYSTTLWSKLQNLFDLVDTGNDDLGIPPYNGGLFDDDRHEFLAEHEVSDRHLAEVIYRISTTDSEQNGGDVLADYADLDTRHLGSIYEGLLEHRFRIASEDMAAVAEDGAQEWKPATEVSVADAVETVEDGELFVINDDGERKATGAYYTPDYVVTYIVEETIDPLLEDIREDLEADGYERGESSFVYEFALLVKDLKILDPAMGSGHFLTKATGYLTEQIMAEAREAEVGTLFDEQRIKRQIAKECIYGVDLNEMATELAKLSMWLETLAADQPLAFLDHHLKTGNSVVGSDIEGIQGLESDTNNNSAQSSLAEFGATRQGTIERLMDVYEEFLAIENENLSDIKEMEQKYKEIEQDDLRNRLLGIANVQTANDFGVEIPSGAYEQMAKSLESDEKWEDIINTDWFQKAHELSITEGSFHWKLEYPEVFYNSDGTVRPDQGFDVVIGNPPYVFISNISEYYREYYKSIFDTWHRRYDLYGVFIEQGSDLLSEGGEFGFIIPHNLITNNSFEYLREFLLDNYGEIQLIDFDSRVFNDAAIEAMLLLGKNHGDNNSAMLKSTLISPEELSINDVDLTEYPASVVDSLPGQPFVVRGGDWIPKIIEHESTKPLDCYSESVQGVITGNNSEFISEEKVDDRYRPLLRGDDIGRYSYEWGGEYVLYDPDEYDMNKGARPRDPKFWDANRKIMAQAIRNVQLNRRIVACIDESQHVGLNSTINIITKPEKEISIYYIKSILSSTMVNEYFRNCFIDNNIATQNFDSIPIYHVDRDVHVDKEDEAEEILRKNNDDDESIDIDNILNDIRNVSKGTEILCYHLLDKLSRKLVRIKSSYMDINLNLLDYLGTYSDGPSLATLSPVPPKGLADSVLTDTTQRRENLRVGSIMVERDNDELTVLLSARYKPEDEDDSETDQWGYTETDLEPAMRFTGLDEEQAMLIEAFVPYAVEEAGGFAGFRETATKTNSLIDRLEELTLPELDDVADGLMRYRDAKERAAELDEKIEQTDELIDEIVYELYGLTDEEIEIVEKAVGK